VRWLLLGEIVPSDVAAEDWVDHTVRPPVTRGSSPGTREGSSGADILDRSFQATFGPLEETSAMSTTRGCVQASSWSIAVGIDVARSGHHDTFTGRGRQMAVPPLRFAENHSPYELCRWRGLRRRAKRQHAT